MSRAVARSWGAGAGDKPLRGADRRVLGRVSALARQVAVVVAGTALIAVVGQVSLPLPFTPVPVTLGTFAVLVVGAACGSRLGAASAVLLAVAAACGAPVLAGGGHGVGVTFGYVLGYALAAALAGRAGRCAGSGAPGAGARPRAATASPAWSVGLGGRVGAAGRVRAWLAGLPARAVWMLAASAAVYVPGLVWLWVSTGLPWGATLAVGLAPFLVGDVLKSLLAAAACGWRVGRPTVDDHECLSH